MIFEEWHAKFVFVAAGYRRRYGHGKSWNRAHKHYKKNWTLLQRLLWRPVFKEVYEDKYRFMAILSYIQSALTIILVCIYLISEYILYDYHFFAYSYIAYGVFWFLRFMYNNSIGKGEI